VTPFLRLWERRELIATLTLREVKTRYRGSLLGWLWSLLNPLLLLLTYTVVFSLIFRPRLEGAEPYALFLFTGLLPWLWLSGALNESTTVLQDNASLLKKVLFPAEVLPAMKVLSHGVHFLLALPVLLTALALAGRLKPWALFALVPMVLQTATLVGFCLVAAVLSTYFRDLKDLLMNLLNFLFFATPIIYLREMIPLPALRTALGFNPLTSLFRLWQDALFFGGPPSLKDAAVAAGLAVLSLAAGLALFHRLRENIPERL